MLRRLFTVLSASSLLLYVAIVVLWVGSRGHPARVKGSIGGHDYGIRSARGGVEVWRGWDPWDLMDSADPYRPLGSVAGRLGVERAGSWDDNAGGFFQSRGLRFPHALPAALATAAPLAWAARRLAQFARQRAATRRPGHCPHCAYDLRATPGRCPECGATAAPERALIV